MTNILLIEDETLVRETIQDLLEIEGYSVLSASNGSQGIQMAQAQQPDLIICDIMMPEVDGYEVLTRLRANGDTAIIPFIFLTAIADRPSLRQGMVMGADDYLTKPLTRSELLGAINSRLKKQAAIINRYETGIREAEEKLYELLNFDNPDDLRPLSHALNAAQLALYLLDNNQLYFKVSYPAQLPLESVFSNEHIKATFGKKEIANYRMVDGKRLAYLPLLQAGEVLGVLAVLFESNVTLNKEALDTTTQRHLVVAANQVAQVINRTRLKEQPATVSETVNPTNPMLAALSHELRAPLTSIKAGVAGLSSESIDLQPEERKYYLHLIDEEVDRLDRLITRLSEFSQIQAGKLKLAKGLYYLPEIILATLDRLQRNQVLADSQIKTVFEEQLPLVSVDYLLLEQVFGNLLENAVKYSPPDSTITITVTQATWPLSENPQPANGAARLGLLVEVADQGNGIPESELGAIFDYYYRANSKSVGYGLGLAICKGIIEAHGGTITAKPNQTRGTIFTFFLPL